MEKMFNSCTLCPRNCKVNRNNGELGVCRATNKMKIGGYHLHMWEEPIITGENGSGTIFFSYCNLGCIYCQNYDISLNCSGEEISENRLASIMMSLEERGASNINLVTPSHYLPLIVSSIKMAKDKGLSIPIVYNTSGYEKIESLKLIEDYIDIYLPDFKYYDNKLGKYSKVNDYFEYASIALDYMYRKIGKPVYDDKGNLIRGIIVRHLVLPGHTSDSKKIIKYLYDKYQNNIIYSIMNQYTPIRKLSISNLNRKVSKREYDSILDYAYELGIRNCFVQEEGSQMESFIPKFKGDNWI